MESMLTVVTISKEKRFKFNRKAIRAEQSELMSWY